MSKAFPKDRPGRLTAVGIGLYGTAWRRRLATGLSISRSTLHAWLRGFWTKSKRDIDGDLLALIDAERDACAERGVSLTHLRNQLLGKR